VTVTKSDALLPLTVRLARPSAAVGLFSTMDCAPVFELIVTFVLFAKLISSNAVVPPSLICADWKLLITGPSMRLIVVEETGGVHVQLVAGTVSSMGGGFEKNGGEPSTTITPVPGPKAASRWSVAVNVPADRWSTRALLPAPPSKSIPVAGIGFPP